MRENRRPETAPETETARAPETAKRRGRGPGRPFTRGEEHKRGPGQRFIKGQSGNPGGRPKGAKTIIYSIRELVGEAVVDTGTRAKAVATVKTLLGDRKMALPALELAAKLSRELGREAEVAPTVIVTVHTNVDLERMRRGRSS